MQLKDLLKADINLSFSNTVKHIGNLNITGIIGTIGAVYEKNGGPFLVICADNFVAQSIKSTLVAVLPKVKVEYLQDWETLPYDTLSPHQDIVSSRISILSRLKALKNEIVVTTVQAIMPRLSPVDYIKANSFSISKGDIRDIQEIQKEMTSHGYLRVEQVLAPGELAIRGSILDIYPMGSDVPYRIDFFDDEVDSIRVFDVDTQRSLEQIDKIALLPAHEYPLNEKSISVFRSNYRDAFIGANFASHSIYQAISRGAIPAGIEYYMSLFFGSMSSIFEYLSDDYKIITVDDVKKAVTEFDVEAHKRALEFAGNSDHPPLPVSQVFLNPQEVFDNLKK